MALESYYSLKKKQGEVIVTLGGHLRATQVPRVLLFFQSNKFFPSQAVCLDLKSLKSVDTSGSWALLRFVESLKQQKIPVRLEHVSVEVQRVLDHVGQYVSKKNSKESRVPSYIRMIEALGKTSYTTYQSSKSLLDFLGQIFVSIMLSVLQPRRVRFKALCTMIQRVGYDALPVVGLISFLIGVVLIYQSVDQLRRFGAEILAVDLLTISVMREIGILLTSIVIAGRSGSAFTAQLGFMKLNQEVDAMVVMAMNPLEVLVLPRILALMISLPLLAFYSVLMALLGGALMSLFLLGLSLEQFFQQVQLAVSPWTFWIGIIKAPFFAAMIGIVACFEGLRVGGGAQSVGIHTTKSVVEGIFMVIILDAIFSIVFSYIGI